MHNFKRPDRPASDKFWDVIRFLAVSFFFGIILLIGLGSKLCGNKPD